MQKGQKLHFSCLSCDHSVNFSIFELESQKWKLVCSNCEKSYSFGDETLKRQLKKFASLCREILESEEILSRTSVGIKIGEHQVEVPYNILLTRLNSHLNLVIGDRTLKISFRIEPGKDILPSEKNKSL